MQTMDRAVEIFDKYLGDGLSQDPFRLGAVRTFCSAVMQTDGWEVLTLHANEEDMRGVLDEGDFLEWANLKSGIPRNEAAA